MRGAVVRAFVCCPSKQRYCGTERCDRTRAAERQRKRRSGDLTALEREQLDDARRAGYVGEDAFAAPKQHSLSFLWKHELGVDGTAVLPRRWIEHGHSDPGLAARYRSVTGEPYLTRALNDWSQTSEGWGTLPEGLWKEIEPHWRYRRAASSAEIGRDPAV
jgi:hypothetical protein